MSTEQLLKLSTIFQQTVTATRITIQQKEQKILDLQNENKWLENVNLKFKLECEKLSHRNIVLTKELMKIKKSNNNHTLSSSNPSVRTTNKPKTNGSTLSVNHHVHINKNRMKIPNNSTNKKV